MNDLQHDYPILIYEDLKLHGLIAIFEGISTEPGPAHQKRMWLMILLNELWYGSAQYIISERIIVIKQAGPPNPQKVYQARVKLRNFLTDLDKWLQENYYLDQSFSYVDAFASSVISFLDYLNEVDWDQYKHCKEWYSRIKSRPSFAAILDVIIPGLKPPRHYKLIDF